MTTPDGHGWNYNAANEGVILDAASGTHILDHPAAATGYARLPGGMV